MNTTLTTSLTLTRPDDWHLHVRDGAALQTVVPHTAAQFGRAIIMPNLKPPVTTAALAMAYKARILAAVPAGVQFEPLMTLYLTDNLPPEEIVKAKAAGVVACKLYPAGPKTQPTMSWPLTSSWAQRSQPIICCSTAMPSSLAVSGHITTACLS